MKKKLIYLSLITLGLIPFAHAESGIVYDTNIDIPFGGGDPDGSPFTSWTWYKSLAPGMASKGSSAAHGGYGSISFLDTVNPSFIYQILDYQIERNDQAFKLDWWSLIQAAGPSDQHVILFWTDMDTSYNGTSDYGPLNNDINSNIIGEYKGSVAQKSPSDMRIDPFDSFFFEAIAVGNLQGKHLGIAMQSTAGINFDDFVLSTGAAAVPEPSSYALFAGVLGLGVFAVRRRRK